MLSISSLKEEVVIGIIKAFASQKSTIDMSVVKDVQIKEYDVINHIHSGSHVLQTNKGFFRFCEVHLRRKQYTYNRLLYHLNVISFSEADKSFLLEQFKDRKRIEAFSKMSLSKRYKDNNYSDFSNKTGLAWITGFKPSNQDSFNENLYELAYCIAADLNQYRFNKYINSPQTFSSNRILAQQSLAKLLKVGYMFPYAEYVNLLVEGQPPAFGLLMESSCGLYPLKLMDKMPLSVSPNLQRDLSILNFHDIICNEKDHRPGNYHVLLDENHSKVERISVFDNDCKWTFFPSFSLKYIPYAGASPLISKNGEINRPFMDRSYAEGLLHLSKHDIKRALHPYLNTIQLFAICNKINRLKVAIVKTMHSRPDFLLDSDQWDNTTIQKELNWDNGPTYLGIYYNWYNRMQKEHPEIFNSFNINLT